MSIEPWLPILQWKDIPCFSTVHDLPFQDFRDLYARDDPQLQGFTDNLWEGLQGESAPNAARIESPPGWGKTSCFYWLAQRAQTDGLRHYLYVLHARQLVSASGVDVSATTDRCLDALGDYFTACAPDKSFATDIRTDPDLTQQQKLNRLTEYLKLNKSHFSKRLVVIIDDVDVVPEKHVIETAETVFRLLQPASMIKWLAIRGITLSGYNFDSRTRLCTLFPARYRFPAMPLYKILSTRLQRVSGDNSINPFSQRLCAHIDLLHAGDHRQSLATLYELLQTSNPGNITPDNAQVKFIERYVERMAVATLLGRNSLPNIFTPYGNVNVLLPLPKEVLALLYVYRMIDRVFIDLINTEVSQKLRAITGAHQDASLKRKDIFDAATFLSRLGLISFYSENQIEITAIGWQFQPYVDQQYYIELCQGQLVDQQTDSVFWKMALAETRYREMRMEELFGKGEPVV